MSTSNEWSRSRHPVLAWICESGQRRAAGVSIDVQLLQQRERVPDDLQQILVVLDHLAAHVHAKPLLVDEQLIAIEPVGGGQAGLREQSRQEHRTLEAERDGLEVG